MAERPGRAFIPINNINTDMFGCLEGGDTMIEAIFDDLYRVEIPLPKNPLRATNSYFIRGSERNLIIDTGFNRAECRESMDAAVKELDFDLDKTDLFITHLHGDHSGLIVHLARHGMTVYGGEYHALCQASAGNSGPNWSYFNDLMLESGLFASDKITSEAHPGYKFASPQYGKIKVVKDGDWIQVGRYNFRCVETQGHAPDHICLYEQDKKLFLCGDHILKTITPNITVWAAPWNIKRDYLGEYLQNLEKCAALDISLALPGHRGIIEDIPARVNELKEHHRARLSETLDILSGEELSGVMTASRMHWDLSYKSWDEFPPAQRIFATGEALAHLTHLVFTGEVKKERKDGIVYFKRTSDK